MTDALEQRYEDELNYVRRLANEFARNRPKIADRLLLDRETGASEDPHVERLIEAFAFLTARVRLKLDDEFSDITDALLSVLYPHYLAPVPSMSIVQFLVDKEQGQLTEGFTIPAQSRLFSRPVNDVSCQFRTVYPVTLWPIELVAADYQTAPFRGNIVPPGRASGSPGLLRLELRTLPGSSFNTLKLDRLRFFLSGDDATARTLYELIFNHVGHVVIRGDSARTKPLVVNNTVLQAVGFGRDEGMLPYPARSFPGYRLLTEYFTFPQKFLFFDICGLERVAFGGFGDRLEILLFLDRTVPDFEHRVNADNFRMGCCPIVNLFSQDADPIRLTQTKSRYHVIPDVRYPGSMEVYSIDSVRSTNLATHQTIDYEPFYSFKHASDAQRQTYWSARREPSLEKNDSGTEVFLSLVDMDFDPALPAAEVVTVRTTCTNRNLPGRLRASGGEHWGFQLDGHAPLERIVPLVLPTASVRMPFEHGRWRLISHLALNHLSITDREDGAAALREILTLYDVANSKVSAQHIAGILEVASRRCVAPIVDGSCNGFCRGLEITVNFDEEKYAGSGVFLLAAVLDRFFALYASLNSATRLIARSSQRQGHIKRWPFRVGEKTLV